MKIQKAGLIEFFRTHMKLQMDLIIFFKQEIKHGSGLGTSKAATGIETDLKTAQEQLEAAGKILTHLQDIAGDVLKESWFSKIWKYHETVILQRKNLENILQATGRIGWFVFAPLYVQMFDYEELVDNIIRVDPKKHRPPIDIEDYETIGPTASSALPIQTHRDVLIGFFERQQEFLKKLTGLVRQMIHTNLSKDYEDQAFMYELQTLSLNQFANSQQILTDLKKALSLKKADLIAYKENYLKLQEKISSHREWCGQAINSLNFEPILKLIEAMEQPNLEEARPKRRKEDSEEDTTQYLTNENLRLQSENQQLTTELNDLLMQVKDRAIPSHITAARGTSSAMSMTNSKPPSLETSSSAPFFAENPRLRSRNEPAQTQASNDQLTAINLQLKTKIEELKETLASLPGSSSSKP